MKHLGTNEFVLMEERERTQICVTSFKNQNFLEREALAEITAEDRQKDGEAFY